MVNYREILRLKSLGRNTTEIASAIRASRNTVRDVLDRSGKAGVGWPIGTVTNEDLFRMLYPEKRRNCDVYKEPDCEWIHRELARPGVTLSLLHTEYVEGCLASAEGLVPYKYTQFCDKYRAWARKTRATMRIQHKPGETMEVDWAGNTLPIHDPVTGDIEDAYLFVAVLPCSCFAYVELCSDMRTESWLLCHSHAYQYFGGVTRLLIPDNLKTGITKNTRLDLILNRSYAELADHYETAVVPARIKAPKDKSNAEGTVKFASTWILAALRDQPFFSLEEAKAAVSGKLEELNNKPFKKRAGSRRSAYLDEEKEFMQPLPVSPYEPAVWSTATVHDDYAISDGLNKYSVPFDLIGEEVDIRLARDTVEVFWHGNRVASHVRLHKAERDPIVVPEHMPENHRKYLLYTAAEFRAWAATVGPNTQKAVEYFLTSGRQPEQGYKPCVTLMKMGDKTYSHEKIEEACGRLLAFSNTPSIRSLAALLHDGHPGRKSTTVHKSAGAFHHNNGITRGPDYYREGGVRNA